MSLLAAVPVINSAIEAIKKYVPDKDLANKLNADLDKVGGDVIKTEAQGNSWLQRNWRPLTMISFLLMLWSYWLGYTPPNVSPENIDSIFLLIRIGLGGYVVGRSVEKVASVWSKK